MSVCQVDVGNKNNGQKKKQQFFSLLSFDQFSLDFFLFLFLSHSSVISNVTLRFWFIEYPLTFSFWTLNSHRQTSTKNTILSNRSSHPISFMLFYSYWKFFFFSFQMASIFFLLNGKNSLKEIPSNDKVSCHCCWLFFLFTI